jgi:hypothetical protein
MKLLLRIILIAGVFIAPGCSSGDQAKEDKDAVKKDAQAERDGTKTKLAPVKEVPRDKKQPQKIEQPKEEFIPVYALLMVEPRFMDHGLMLPSRDNPEVKEEDKRLGGMSLRFGIIMPQMDSPRNKQGEIEDKEANPSGKKRLTYFDEGISNNTCVRIDENDYLLGSGPSGRWLETNKPLGVAHDGPDHGPRKRQGRTSVYLYAAEKVQVSQTVEVVPSEQPSQVKIEEKPQDVRVLDRILVRYVIENKDDKEHRVGLRFLLDTFIGTNDGVPFLLPGVKDLCDTKREFDPSKGPGMAIPDYIQALEFPDIKKPGTIAHLSLRLAGIEVPSRVTLGAWPHVDLQRVANQPKAGGHLTMWDVPYVDMKTGKRNDSAVTMYWNEKPLQPKEKRVVGFAYGLGSLAATGGKIGLSVGGSFVVGGTFTVTALVSDPQAGETVTLHLPPEFTLVKGEATQNVPALPAKAQSQSSPVTWKVTASKYGRREIKVTRSTGGSQKKMVVIASKLSLVD